jgi:hypothetical protein
MSNYSQTIQKLAGCLNDLCMGYIESLSTEPHAQESAFACRIVSILDRNKDLLHLISKMHRRDLVDSLVTHSDKYAKFMESHAIDPGEITAFKNSITSLTHIPDDADIANSELQDTERDAISELAYKMVKKSQIIFAEQSHNKESLYSLLALAVASNLSNLSLKDQSSLFDQLLLIKEVWSLNPSVKLTPEHPKFKFFLNPYQALELEATDDLHQTFASIISYLAKKNDVLEDLTDENLIVLYDRLKNYDWNSDSLPILLSYVHTEAQFRYSYNRLTDSGYELLKRFQSFDAIAHQIENLEFCIMESYLLRRQLFADEMLSLIARHLDNIRALNITKNEHLTSMLNKISSSLLKKVSNNSEAGKAMLSSIKSKLDRTLEPHVKKRYSELDQYALKFLQQKYFDLFENITNLIEEKDEYKTYLNEVFVSKLASDYYLPNWSNSIERLRIVAKDRKKVKAELLKLNFIEMYQPQYLNKITSLNFRRGISETDLKSFTNYISGVIREIVLSCTAFQLEVLYKPLLSGKLSKTQALLKDEIISQIHQRTSIKQMLYSILVGRKKEYDKLTKIGKNIKTVNSDADSDTEIAETQLK